MPCCYGIKINEARKTWISKKNNDIQMHKHFIHSNLQPSFYQKVYILNIVPLTKIIKVNIRILCIHLLENLLRTVEDIPDYNYFFLTYQNTFLNKIGKEIIYIKIHYTLNKKKYLNTVI